MNKKSQITFDRCQRVLAFLDDHDRIWEPGDPVRSISISLRAVHSRLAETSTRHLLLEQGIRQATREKTAAMHRLKPRVRNLIRLAQTFPDESFGFQTMTYYHGKLRVGEWIDLGRSLLEQFATREGELVEHGAQPGVLDGLRGPLEMVEKASAKQEAARMERLRVTRELGAIQREARGWFRRLNAIMRLRFEEDRVRLSQWQRANRDHVISRGEGEGEAREPEASQAPSGCGMIPRVFSDGEHGASVSPASGWETPAIDDGNRWGEEARRSSEQQPGATFAPLGLGNRSRLPRAALVPRLPWATDFLDLRPASASHLHGSEPA